MKTHCTIHAHQGIVSPSGVRHYYWQWAHLAYSHQIHIEQSRLLYGTIPMIHVLNNLNLLSLIQLTINSPYSSHIHFM